MAMDGKQILILVKSGLEYIACAESTGFSWEETVNMIEVSSKDENHTKWIPGKKDSTAEQNGFYVPNDPAYLALKSAFDNNEPVILRRSEEGVQVEEAEAWITNFSGDAPDNDGSTMGISYQLNEAWAVVVA